MTQTTSKAPIALVTGGSRGLGRSMALHLADQGVDSIVTYHSRAEEAAEVVRQIRAKGRKAVALQLDVGDASSFGAFAERVVTALRTEWSRERFDYLVNNAGIGLHATIAQITEAQFDELVHVHFKGPVFLTQKLLPLISDGGRILNVSSGLARFSFLGYAVYGALKGAIEVFTRYLAQELGPRRITANVLAPGAIATDFGGGAVRDNEQLNQMIAAQTSLGRVGEADDIGRAVALLLGPAGGWINGQRIEASGGFHL
jgi:NAD(P)-dependent dehydrogenase (short-subunit alcohol dehydrogenase family)